MEKETNTIPRYLFLIIVLLLVISSIWLIFSISKEPVIEYRNQSCELVDTGWTKEHKLIINLTLLEERYGYDKVPEEYTLIEVYREVCNEGVGCKYYKQNLYYKKEVHNSSQP